MTAARPAAPVIKPTDEQIEAALELALNQPKQWAMMKVLIDPAIVKVVELKIVEKAIAQQHSILEKEFVAVEHRDETFEEKVAEFQYCLNRSTELALILFNSHLENGVGNNAGKVHRRVFKKFRTREGTLEWKLDRKA